MNDTESGAKKAFSAKDLIETFSSTLELFAYDGGLYLYDDYHKNDEGLNYGISYMMSLEEAEKDGISIGDIPDIFVENEIDFLLQDDLSNTYKVDKKTISELSSLNSEKWADILIKNGYDDVVDTLDTTLRMMNGEYSLPVTESDYYIQQDEGIISKIEKTNDKEEVREATIEQNKVNQSFDEVKEYADFLVSEGTLDADALLDTQYLKDVTAAYMRDNNEYEDNTEKLQVAFSSIEKTECYKQEIKPINKKADIERD